MACGNTTPGGAGKREDEEQRMDGWMMLLEDA